MFSVILVTLLELFRVFHHTADKPCPEAVCKDALPNGAVKGSLFAVIFPEDSQKVFFTICVLFLFQVSSSSMWTPRKQKSLTISTQVTPMRLKDRFVSPKVYD
ncbi:hypothetical protein ATANTOWER_003898 [Ataeniobius toweri]|uniref:Secreted protein n=1 Tax=Ataeniobius toweri TaxID=208326 RepID=A0ABU7AY76_9TELE|nr:hypothetical protein [Ataeniobius toweri]